MGNNNLKTTNDILIKIDHNNLIYIDPNSVLNNGIVEPRSVQPENLMMYVNLEADLIPRTTLIANDNKSTITSIAKGTLNFMQNSDGTDYDATWTDTFTNKKFNITGFNTVGFGNTAVMVPTVEENTDTQTFGIQDISIKVMGANFIPRVDIKFIDVRGKTLFESPRNSPYAAFFHIPWPIFYLTVKGYYGKAIKYRLHLVKFNSKFNSSNGNFEIDCNFVGSTYAYLADISLESVLNAPYFYLTKLSGPAKYNEKTGMKEQQISKTTKGYRVLRSVYQEYISKGFLPKDFPVRTLREIIVLSGRLNKILERKIFHEIISHYTLAAVKEYEDIISSFVTAINIWKTKNLSAGSYFTAVGSQRNGEDILWYTVLPGSKDPVENFTKILTNYTDKLDSNLAFGEEKPKKSEDHKDITLVPISCRSLKDIKQFYRTQSEVIGFDIDGVISEIQTINQNFKKQRNKLEDDIEQIMNKEISDNKDIGIGFNPTIRNVIAILLANAETYIRLMRDVHEKAFERADDRKRVFSDQSISSNALTTDCISTIYPWPEVKIAKQKDKENVLIYPGNEEIAEKLGATDRNLWPEVDFIENFYEISTKIKDNLVVEEGSTEGVHYTFGDTPDLLKKDISVLTNQMNYIPYTDKTISSLLYEIYERAKHTTSVSPFDGNSIIELADVEYSNLKDQIGYDIDVIETLKRNIKDVSRLLSQMESSVERYQYYLDQTPTTPYIQEGINNDFKIEKYSPSSDRTKGTNNDYKKVQEFLKQYKAENYRSDIYPFNSTTYNTYLSNGFNKSSLNLNNILQVNAPTEFISSPFDADMWIKEGYQSNMFLNKLTVGGLSRHILNTPYFHKQLYNDFIKDQSVEKYVGSAYLFLNSLPYKDLDDIITYDGKNVLMSTMFREIGSSHFIPYHLMIKWGSIYHRYKKYILENIDIINNVNERIDGDIFFDNNNNLTFNTIPDVNTGTIKTVQRSDNSDVGFHPYYETIFHQIINGYGYMDITSPVNSYSEKITNGTIKLHYDPAMGANAWTSFVDNTKFNSNDLRYTLLPTNGYDQISAEDFTLAEQENFRILWINRTNNTVIENNIDYSIYEFPTYNQYFKDINNEYSISTNNKKVIDLIATFKPEILEIFENAFLDFASEKLNEASPYKPYDVLYSKFQDILKEISSVRKDTNDDYEDDYGLYTKIKERQLSRLVDLTTEMKLNNNMIRMSLSNPREINDYIFGGFTGIGVRYFSPGTFDLSQVTPENTINIELYLGEDMNGYYEDFFSINDIELNEDNIKQFRPLIYIYAGLRSKGENPTKSEFVQYIKDNIIEPPPVSIGSSIIKKPSERLNNFLEHIIGKIQGDLEPLIEETQFSPITRGWNDDPTIKLELYNYFKSFNDKWTAGNSIGQRSLIEEFLFLDRANKDIGDKVYINLEKLLRIGLAENSKINLYGAISLLVQDTGFDIRALPAYVNFYGTTASTNTKSRLTPSKDIAKSMFGSFLDVDYQDATPKIILQYMGPSSKHLDMGDVSKRNYLFNDDGVDVSQVNNCPIIATDDVFASTDFSKSNKVVAFEVSFGDQNQSIFKSIELDQSTIRNTSESFYVLENLGRSEGGSSTAQVDINLWQIYRQASYQCQVTCMGNVMIQPTMYFNLKNVPLFKGSYWITEVTHNIKPAGIETIFKGSRIPNRALPDPDSSFIASYRPLFDRIVKDAVAKVQNENTLSESSKTEKVAVTNSGTYSYDTSIPPVNNDEKLLSGEHGVMPYGIPYNGYDGEQNIQLIEYKGERWLRTPVVELGSYSFNPNLNRTMTILTKTDFPPEVKYSDVYNPQYKDREFYISKFNLKRISNIRNTLFTEYYKTEFLNPKNNDKRYEVIHFCTHNQKAYQGPVDVGGADMGGYGMALSSALMNKLGLFNGQIVYFRLTNK